MYLLEVLEDGQFISIHWLREYVGRAAKRKLPDSAYALDHTKPAEPRRRSNGFSKVGSHKGTLQFTWAIGAKME